MLFATEQTEPLPGWVLWMVGAFLTTILAAVFGMWGRSQWLQNKASLLELDRLKQLYGLDQERAKFRDEQLQQFVLGLQSEIKRLREVMSNAAGSNNK